MWHPLMQFLPIIAISTDITIYYHYYYHTMTTFIITSMHHYHHIIAPAYTVQVNSTNIPARADAISG